MTEGGVREARAAGTAGGLPVNGCETCKGRGVLRDKDGGEPFRCPDCGGHRERSMDTGKPGDGDFTIVLSAKVAARACEAARLSGLKPKAWVVEALHHAAHQQISKHGRNKQGRNKQGRALRSAKTTG